MRTIDIVKLYQLKYGKLIVDRRFVLEVFQHDFKLGTKLHKSITKGYEESKKKYANPA